MTAFAWLEDDESGETRERAWLFHRGAGGPLIGFGVAGAFAWDLAGEDPDAAVWATPRFDVPSFALRGGTVGEVVLAAQRTLTGSTPDSVEFALAVEAGMSGDRERAEEHWRACLACGEMSAHYGLGYTLVELGRPREAFGHLAMYTEICPRNAWAWAWRGRAAQRMGETAEARRAYDTALALEAAGYEETDAASWLAELPTEPPSDNGATVTTTHAAPPPNLTSR
jgi:tetratricopeptide (TPR) repeat protein